MGTKMKAENLDFYYGSFQALDKINMDIEEKKVTALIGPSGCGKSTFIKTLNRMNDLVEGSRAEGKIMLEGKDVLGGEIDVVELRKRVGMVFQKPNPFPKSIYDPLLFQDAW